MGTGADRQLQGVSGNRRFEESGGLHRGGDGVWALMHGRTGAQLDTEYVHANKHVERGRCLAQSAIDSTSITYGSISIPNSFARRPQRGQHLPADSAERKGQLITDDACREIAASIAHELAELGAPFKAFVLEDLAPRPLTDLPPEIADDMETSDVSIFAVRVQRNELKSRMEMTDIVNRRRMRHAHMVNINRQIMLEGMRADFNKVDALSRKVTEIVSKAKEIRATNPAGSDFTAKLNPNYRWVKTSGIISRDKWGNLPGGEIFTTPGEVNGVCVVDGVVGDYLCEKYPGPGAPAADHPHRQEPHHRHR